jgi:acetyl esterase/lipase
LSVQREGKATVKTSAAGFIAGWGVAGLCALACAPSATQERTSETDVRLKETLRRFPQADADGDGMLTARETRAFRQGVEAQRRRIEEQATRGPAPTLENVRYGPHERNVMDLWLAESPSPTPLAVFIHGGGGVGGDKSRVRGGRSLRTCLDAGVSFASINDRFREHAAIQDDLRDAAKAIQTIRSRARE